jgi:hypothetical protein
MKSMVGTRRNRGDSMSLTECCAALLDWPTDSPRRRCQLTTRVQRARSSPRGFPVGTCSRPELLRPLRNWTAGRSSTSRHLDALVDLEAHAPAAVSGETLLQFDVRADNVLLDSDNVWFFDWPHACVGAAWFDVVAFALSVTMQGGPPPEDVLARYPGNPSADPDAVTCALAAVAGTHHRSPMVRHIRFRRTAPSRPRRFRAARQ